jgi:hypothetical protein
MRRWPWYHPLPLAAAGPNGKGEHAGDPSSITECLTDGCAARVRLPASRAHRGQPSVSDVCVDRPAVRLRAGADPVGQGGTVEPGKRQ